MSDVVRRELRALPSVDRLATQVARAELEARRREILQGDDRPVDLIARARARLAPSLRSVVNATGVVLHTNLGRAPLPLNAQAALADVAGGYSNLELDLQTGKRGSRHVHIERLLSELIGCEAAMVVNNGAAAALLAVSSVASKDDGVLVARSQLVEIGGGFRIPDLVTSTGARLVEVGTTNRVRLSDYRDAIDERTAAILRVHQSNFRTVGFVSDADLHELCALGLPIVDDVGSGLLNDELLPASDEPTARDSVAAGAALTVFSADKLLGGPQAGIIVGNDEAIRRCRSHPLARVARIDKLSLAALEATLALYRDPALARAQVPVLAMLETPDEVLSARARRLAERIGGVVSRASARVGGGALPLLELEGPVVEFTAPECSSAREFAARLRTGASPIVVRVRSDRVVFDPRTLSDADVEIVVAEVERQVQRECR